MNLEEAIKHARQKAKEMRILSTANYGGIESCLKCAEEHEQLAEWLEELQNRRNMNGWVPVTKDLPDEGEEVIVTDGKFYGMSELTSGITAEGVCFWFDSWEDAIAWRPIPKYEGGKEDE